MSTYSFFAIIHKDVDSEYGISFPDVPGCFSAGATREEAIIMAKEALQGHLEWMIEDGDAIPKGRILSQSLVGIEESGLVGIEKISVMISSGGQGSQGSSTSSSTLTSISL